MSFDKKYPNRKDKRKPYKGSKAFSGSCRPHGKCDYCRGNRLHGTKRRKAQATGEES